MNLDDVLDDLHGELKEYTGVEQLTLGTQDIPPKKMKYPRIRVAVTLPSNPVPRQSIIHHKKAVDYDPERWPDEEEEYDTDVLYTYVVGDTATLSVTAYGSNINHYIKAARRWFMLEPLGKRILKSHEIVINQVLQIEDRTTHIETEYEQRKGFDVLLGWNEELEIHEKAIERVEIRGSVNGKEISKEVDI